MRIIKFNLIFTIVLLSSILSSPFVMSYKGDIPLLTVGETSQGVRSGGTAELFLEVRPGSGRVFIDSFPFTSEDTQISIRFAKDVACNFLEVDCSRLDFFYTINIKSSSVRGPSAGAAIAVLTVSVLNNDKLDEHVAITGTINSGGIIGPVSGIEEKALAAKAEGFKKILVPKRSILTERTLSEINLTEDEDFDINFTIHYADSLVIEGIEIIPVSTLEEALFQFSGKRYPDYSYDIKVPEQYQEIMARVANQLCERSYDIMSVIPNEIIDNNSTIFEQANNSISLGLNASTVGDYYSAASFCFTANTALRSLEFQSYSDEVLESYAQEIRNNTNNLIEELNSRELRSMSDLETYIIVKERLLEVQNLLNEPDYLNNLGYITERRYSAIAWSSFFDFDGQEVELNEVHLSNACISKISEAEERLSYVDFLTESFFDRTELREAMSFFDSQDYAFCIFRASKVKADANALILAMSLTRERATELIDDQLMFAKIQINKQEDNFPILGYSYYNYALSLQESRPQLSMIFAEYASEFSNLDMYFPSKRQTPVRLLIVSSRSFFVGVFVGVMLSVGLWSLITLIHRSFFKKKSRRKEQKKKK